MFVDVCVQARNSNGTTVGTLIFWVAIACSFPFLPLLHHYALLVPSNSNSQEFPWFLKQYHQHTDVPHCLGHPAKHPVRRSSQISCPHNKFSQQSNRLERLLIWHCYVNACHINTLINTCGVGFKSNIFSVAPCVAFSLCSLTPPCTVVLLHLTLIGRKVYLGRKSVHPTFYPRY